MAEVETYTMNFYCKNCGEEFKEQIAKGVSTANHITKCPNCGLSYFIITRIDSCILKCGQIFNG